MKAEFSERIKILGEEKGMSQVELAKRLGVHRSIVSSYENQTRLPSIRMLSKLAYFFNVSMEYLLGINKNKTIDVSDLTPEQVSAINAVIEQFKLSNKD